jgi:hypothetical protein
MHAWIELMMGRVIVLSQVGGWHCLNTVTVWLQGGVLWDLKVCEVV